MTHNEAGPQASHQLNPALVRPTVVQLLNANRSALSVRYTSLLYVAYRNMSLCCVAE